MALWVFSWNKTYSCIKAGCLRLLCTLHRKDASSVNEQLNLITPQHAHTDAPAGTEHGTAIMCKKHNDFYSLVDV